MKAVNQRMMKLVRKSLLVLLPVIGGIVLSSYKSLRGDLGYVLRAETLSATGEEGHRVRLEFLSETKPMSAALISDLHMAIACKGRKAIETEAHEIRDPVQSQFVASKEIEFKCSSKSREELFSLTETRAKTQFEQLSERCALEELANPSAGSVIACRLYRELAETQKIRAPSEPVLELPIDELKKRLAAYESDEERISIFSAMFRRYLGTPELIARDPEILDLADHAMSLARRNRAHWDSGNVLHITHMVLGFYFLAKNDIEFAANELILSSTDTHGSARLKAQGPDLSLAKALHGKVAPETIIRFLELSHGHSKINLAEQQVGDWAALLRFGSESAVEPQDGPESANSRAPASVPNPQSK